MTDEWQIGELGERGLSICTNNGYISWLVNCPGWSTVQAGQLSRQVTVTVQAGQLSRQVNCTGW